MPALGEAREARDQEHTSIGPAAPDACQRSRLSWRGASVCAHMRCMHACYLFLEVYSPNVPSPRSVRPTEGRGRSLRASAFCTARLSGVPKRRGRVRVRHSCVIPLHSNRRPFGEQRQERVRIEQRHGRVRIQRRRERVRIPGRQVGRRWACHCPSLLVRVRRVGAPRACCRSARCVRAAARAAAAWVAAGANPARSRLPHASARVLVRGARGRSASVARLSRCRRQCHRRRCAAL